MIRSKQHGLLKAAMTVAVACVTAASFSSSVFAQAYPAKAITIRPTFAAW